MLRTRLPSSRGAITSRVSVFDAVWAFIAPLAALAIRDAYILSYDGIVTTLLYCVLSASFSLIAFLIFRLHDGLAPYFSAHDALDVVKAVICAELITSAVLFTFTRLEGIPRSTPLIHGLILLAGLLTARVIARVFNESAKPNLKVAAGENVIMIGATQLSSLYIKLLGACSLGQHRVLAILDERTQSIGRSMAGVRILATPGQLESIIDEFIVHGLQTSRVIVGGEAALLTDAVLKQIRKVCERRKIKLDFVPQLIGLGALEQTTIAPSLTPAPLPSPDFRLPRYFEAKPIVDFFIALTMLILFPIVIFAAALVLLDVGTPLLFWQQRIGKGGCNFLLLKFRTLRPPFNSRGEPIAEEQRLSRIGRLLRQSRLDELPQLLNVLVGDMSLIGPRPLLPEDQPSNPTTRLMVRPGITGWAQVNGGKFLTAQQKDEYDEYYIRNASIWFDLRITLLTLKILFRRSGASDHAVAANFGGLSRSDKPQPVFPIPRPIAQIPRPTERLGKTRLREHELPSTALGGVRLPSAVENSIRELGKPNG